MKKIIISLLVVALLIGVGFYWYQWRDGSWSSVSPSQNSGVAGQSDKKEYRSSLYQFSFAYPASWTVTEPEDGFLVLKHDANIPNDLAPITIDARGVEPFEEALNAIRGSVQGKSETALTFGPYKAVSISGKLGEDVGEHAGTPFTFTMIDQAGRLFSIDYLEFDPKDLSGRDVYLGIVSSFQFQN